MKTLWFAFTAAAVLAAAATAQKQVPVHPVKGVKSFQVGAAPSKAAFSAIYYSNTLWTGYYGVPGPGEEWIDWGRTRPILPATSTIISGTFGYATSAPLGSGPSARWRVYDGYTGDCISLSAGGLDLSLTGLPGNVFTMGGTAWIVGVDLQGAGACFYLPEGPFGYSTIFNDSVSGPLLSSGDSSANAFDWVRLSTGSCSPGFTFGGNPWAGFHTEFVGWTPSESAGLGNDPTMQLSMCGNSCPGGGIFVSVASTPAAAFSAVGIGVVVGYGIGGPLPAGAQWDIGLAPGVPPTALILGLFPGTATIPITVPPSAAPGLTLAAQWVHKIGPTVRTSNVSMLYVP